MEINELSQDSIQENSEEEKSYIAEDLDEGELDVSSKSSVIIEKNDRSLSEFYRWVKEGRLVINPEWQRNFLWKTKRSSKLIESFLKDIPVPVIYLSKNDVGKYEVIDGLQRLTSVFKFFDNEFALSGLNILTEYEGKKFNQLPQEIQYKLQDVTLRSFELASATSKDLLFVIFERLNTGGVALNRMEIRNCIFRGSLNSLIKELARDENFTSCISQTGLSDRMKDREFVLRFLAFYERTYHKCKKGLGTFLNDFYVTYQNADTTKLKEFEHTFKKAMRATFTVFGDRAFRLRSKNGSWNPRVNAAVFQAIAVPFTNYDLSQITRRADSIYEEYLNLVTTDKTWIECVTSNTARPDHIKLSFEVWSERLNKAIGDELPNDSIRVFSKSLKQEIFQQSNTCNICRQEIKLIDDAALDHEEHYWRGGRTVPENARLTHRHCNMTRGL